MEYKFKMIMLGDYGCGKTSFLNRITNQTYNNNYMSTIGVDYFIKKYDYYDLFEEEVGISEEINSKSKRHTGTERRSEIKLQQKKYNLNGKPESIKKYINIKKKIDNGDIIFDMRIWDTSGQERFSKLINAYYKNLSAAFIMFDLTSFESFKNVKNWYDSLMSNVEDTYKKYFPIIIIGNKCDDSKLRVISNMEAIKMAANFQAKYIECSVKDCINLNEIFVNVVQKLVDNIDN